MRVTLFFLLVAGLFFIGCGKKEADGSKAKGSSSSGNPLTAPVDYIDAAGKAQRSASKTLSAVGLDQAIKMFYGQEGRFPKTLNELVPDYVHSLPPPPAGMKYTYDPQTGVVKVVPQ